jgi:hypothetical protein
VSILDELPHEGGHGRALAADSGGDLYVGGEALLAGTGPEFIVAKVSGLDGSMLWSTVVRGTGPQSGEVSDPDETALDVVLSSDEVVAVGRVRNALTELDLTVVKLSAAAGSELWRATITGNADGDDWAHRVAVDTSGDVVVIGALTEFVDLADPNAGTESVPAVVKLAGIDGTELWRQRIVGTLSPGELAGVSVDLVGDVAVAGWTENGQRPDFTVVKLLGADGSELWRYVLDGGQSSYDRARAMTHTSSGDIVAVGYVRDPDTGSFAVVKLAGGNGWELWRRGIDAPDAGLEEAWSVVLDDDENVIAAGEVTNSYGPSRQNLFVAKLSGQDGTTLWEQNLGGDWNSRWPMRLALDPAGDVVVGGTEYHHSDIVVEKLAGSTGEEIWRHSINGPDASSDVSSDLVVDANGDPILAGKILSKRDYTRRDWTDREDFTVAKLSGTDGSLSRFITGERLAVHRGRWKLISKDLRRLHIPPGTSAGHPELHGGRIEIINPNTGEGGSIDLPAENWGEDAGGRGYKYKGGSGPCRVVLLRPDRSMLRVFCRTPAGLTLDEEPQGSLAVILTLGEGNGADRYCALFGGTVLRDGPRRFAAKDAPRSTDCPIPLP